MLARVLRTSDTTARVSGWSAPSNGGDAVYPNGYGHTAGKAPAEAEIALLHAEVSRLKIEGERSVQESFQRGKAEGERLAREALDLELEAEVANVRRVVHELKEVAPHLRRHTEEQLVRLSISVARRIIHRELTIDKDALETLI